MKTRILGILIICILLLTLAVSCDKSSSSSETPGDIEFSTGAVIGGDNQTSTGTPGGTPGAPHEEPYESTFSMSSSVQEQDRNRYDRFVDKNNDKWANEWAGSSVSSTALVEVAINHGATANYSESFNGTASVAVDSTTVTTPIVVVLTLPTDDSLSSNGLSLNEGSERVYKGVDSGKIGSGMLIVEKSTDKSNWQRADSDEYKNGLFTTNMRTHYGKGKSVEIYSPSGEDLNNGIYIRVTYVYEADHTYDKSNIFGGSKPKTESKMFREQTVFYLCNENIDGVTLHNMSLTNESFPENVKTESGDVAEEFKRAETLIDGSLTVTGFKLDNPMAHVSVSVIHNNYRIDIPETREFTEAGVYEITYSQSLGKRQKTLTVYVDKRTTEEIKNYYFADGFIDGKRIYWEGDYPLFEGGLTAYSISKTDGLYTPIYGTIQNLATGSTIEIFADGIAKGGTLTEAGEYVATFCNNPTFATDTPAGDAYVITYNFVLIPQGTAPGPQINKESLSKYMITNISDYSPKYYGVTYSSAGPGNITIAFTSYQDAFEFAYNYEKGCVEPQSDGSYRYSGSLKVSSKEKYDSLWDLTDAENYFAELAVQELYFDLTDDFTYLTLPHSVIEENKNLKTLELAKSIVVFHNEEDKITSSAGNKLPLIGAKKYQYLAPGLDGTVDTGFNDFEFIKDENGYDSHKIVIVDANGKNIPIEYNKGVAKQLNAAGCATGIITVIEETVYGDKTEYNAIYIDDGVNTTAATVSYYINGNNQTLEAAQSSDGYKLEVNAFELVSVSDELDPMAFVKLTKDGRESYYSFEEIQGMLFNDIGEYSIEFINRLGYSYKIEFTIKKSHFTKITFSGVGTEGLEPITVTLGQEKLELPQLTRYGYDLEFYEDESGKKYPMTVKYPDFGQDTVLTPIWRAKTFTLTITDQFGTVILTKPIVFGETYFLTEPVLSDGSEFIEWLLDGEKYEEDSIYVDEEKDIVLVAHISQPEVLIKFSGEGTEELENISAVMGQTGISLPSLTRYGYIFNGYKDQYGNEYTDVIDRVNVAGEITLSSIWTAKEFTLTVADQNGVVIYSSTVIFGLTYPMPELELSEGTEVGEWIYNGESYIADHIAVEKEENITLTAIIVESQTTETDTEALEETSSEAETETKPNVNPGTNNDPFTDIEFDTEADTAATSSGCSGCSSNVDFGTVAMIAIVTAGFVCVWFRKKLFALK